MCVYEKLGYGIKTDIWITVVRVNHVKKKSGQVDYNELGVHKQGESTHVGRNIKKSTWNRN